MRELSAVELAGMLGLSKGRISQLVSEGKLDGCYRGDGRDRRFDPVACAKAIGKRIDFGQQLGNGASTQRAAASILREEGGNAPLSPPSPQLADYERARTEKAQEEARRLKRVNAEAEGAFVLAEEVVRQVRRQVGQEVAEVATYIRDVARVLADRYHLDFKEVRQAMLDQWRTHRGARADEAESRASSAALSDVESASDI